MGSLLFDGVNDDVGWASATDLDNLDPFTYWGWFYPLDVSAVIQAAWGKSNTSGGGMILYANASTGTAGQSRIRVAFATSPLSYVSAANFVVQDEWNFLVWQMDTGRAANDRANLYRGDLDTIPTSSAPTTQDNSGARTSDAAETLFVGKRNNNDQFDGRIDLCGCIGSYLSAGQIRRLWGKSRPQAKPLLVSRLGYYGTGSQVDWSGNQRVGTLTGPVFAPGCPRPVSRRLGGWPGAFTTAGAPPAAPPAMVSSHGPMLGFLGA